MRPAERGGRRALAGAAAGALGLGLLAALAAPVRAQPFDVPSFSPPGTESGFGMYVITQGDIGILGTWRQGGANVDLGVRGGLVDVGDDLGFLVGVELEGRGVRAGPDFPLDLDWVTGFGVGAVPDRNRALLRIPLGVTIGRTLDLDDGRTALTPYVHPRLAVDVAFFERLPGGEDETEADLHLDVDLGLDLRLSPQVRLRFGATVGHSDAVGVGISF